MANCSRTTIVYSYQMSDLLLSGNKTRHPNAKTTIAYIWQRIIIVYGNGLIEIKRPDGIYYNTPGECKKSVFYFRIFGQ